MRRVKEVLWIVPRLAGRAAEEVGGVATGPASTAGGQTVTKEISSNLVVHQ